MGFINQLITGGHHPVTLRTREIWYTFCKTAKAIWVVTKIQVALHCKQVVANCRSLSRFLAEKEPDSTRVDEAKKRSKSHMRTMVLVYLPLFTYIWAIFRANVGKYSSTMEHMGMNLSDQSCVRMHVSFLKKGSVSEFINILLVEFQCANMWCEDYYNQAHSCYFHVWQFNVGHGCQD